VLLVSSLSSSSLLFFLWLLLLFLVLLLWGSAVACAVVGFCCCCGVLLLSLWLLLWGSAVASGAAEKEGSLHTLTKSLKALVMRIQARAGEIQADIVRLCLGQALGALPAQSLEASDGVRQLPRHLPKLNQHFFLD